MDTVNLRDLLDSVRQGKLGIDEALAKLSNRAIADIGYAHVDLDRHRRCGYPEVVYCEGKTSEWVAGVVGRLKEAGQDCLATRVDENQAAHLARVFPDAQQDRIARTFFLRVAPPCP